MGLAEMPGLFSRIPAMAQKKAISYFNYFLTAKA
jgi:hypothetical protein